MTGLDVVLVLVLTALFVVLRDCALERLVDSHRALVVVLDSRSFRWGVGLFAPAALILALAPHPLIGDPLPFLVVGWAGVLVGGGFLAHAIVEVW